MVVLLDWPENAGPTEIMHTKRSVEGSDPIMLMVQEINNVNMGLKLYFDSEQKKNQWRVLAELKYGFH